MSFLVVTSTLLYILLAWGMTKYYNRRDRKQRGEIK